MLLAFTLANVSQLLIQEKSPQINVTQEQYYRPASSVAEAVDLSVLHQHRVLDPIFGVSRIHRSARNYFAN
jgi:hypothetical protein